MRRTITGIIAVGLIWSVSAVLSAGGSSEAKGNVIQVAVGGGGARDFPRWLESSAEEYKKVRPEIEIKLNEISAPGGEFYTKMALLLQSDSSVDIAFEDSFILRADVAAGYLEPLAVNEWDDWQSQFAPPMQDSVTIDGQVYGIPITTDVRGLFYNKKIFAQVGLPTPWAPKTWAEVLEAAKTVKERAPADVLPLFMNSSKAAGEATTMQTAQMLWYGTNDSMYENGKWVISSPGLLATLEFIDQVYRQELGPSLSLALNSQASSTIYQEYAPADRVAITLDGMWTPQNWIGKWEQWRDHYAFVPMPTENGQAPGFNSMSGGWTLAISKISKNKQEAWEFIKFLNRKERILDLALISNNMIVRGDVADEPQYRNSGVMATASKFLDFTHFRPTNEEYPSVSTELQIAVEAVVTADQSPAEAMAGYERSVTRLVGEERVIRLP